MSLKRHALRRTKRTGLASVGVALSWILRGRSRSPILSSRQRDSSNSKRFPDRLPAGNRRSAIQFGNLRKRNSVDPFMKNPARSRNTYFILLIYRSIHDIFFFTFSFPFFFLLIIFLFCLNKYIHEQGTARQGQTRVWCRCCSMAFSAMVRLDRWLSSFFEPFPIAKRRVKSGRCTFFFFFCFRIYLRV